MGVFDDLFGGGNAAEAAGQNRKLLKKYDQQGNEIIDLGNAKATEHLTGAKDLWGDLSDMSLENLGFYKDALGLSGAEGSAAARDRFQAGPGYQFAMDQGIDALMRSNAARGVLGSGETTLDTLTYAHGLADSEWDGYLDRLQGFDTTNRNMYAAGIGGQAGALGDLATLAGNTTDRKLGVASDVLTGKMGVNNQIAEAKNAGLGNALNLFSGGLKLASGYL